ncbi:hypothetical protein BH18THE1_BH18THE1_10880 [soil metagenome]
MLPEKKYMNFLSESDYPFCSTNFSISNAVKVIPDAVGNGSSTTMLVKSGRIVYNAIEIATIAIMTKTIIVLFFINAISYN